MAYNFATTGWYNCLGDVPNADTDKLRAETVDYISKFNPNSWHDNPVTTVIRGETVNDATWATDRKYTISDTTDALGNINGKQIFSTPAEVDIVIGHIHNYIPPRQDLRGEIRAIDWKFMTTYAKVIIGNQCIDFGKQDGVTEIEESIQANRVEQRLNDKLLEAEKRGEIVIKRNEPVLVGCVSNFSNFLDLCRKVLRHLEVGVPVVVLSRSNCTQHTFRWTQLLLQELKAYNVDLGMVTFLSGTIDEQRRLFAACPNSPMHFTGSRDIARKIKEVVPKLMASTGGPNTLVATTFTVAVGDAVAMSNLIENKGQCTALRHVVCPDATVEKLDSAYARKKVIENGADGLKKGEFSGIFRVQPPAAGSTSDENTYRNLPSQPLVNVKFSADLPVAIDEKWRRLFVDVTTGGDNLTNLKDSVFLKSLAGWLNTEQPITLAINAKAKDYDIATVLFESTGLVVYTVGDVDEKPALTCQARPQEGECFGEFPPRHMMNQITKYPMVVPSPVAAYNSLYCQEYLRSKGDRNGSLVFPSGDGCLQRPNVGGLNSGVIRAWSRISCPVVRGYGVVIIEYLQDVCAHNPKRGLGARTTLFGLQRPPLGVGESASSPANFVRCENLVLNKDLLLLNLLPFLATNASGQVGVSVGGNCQNDENVKKEVQFLQELLGEKYVVLEQSAVFQKRVAILQRQQGKLYNWTCVDAPMEFCLAQQFVSKLFPLGHIKSTQENDEKFVQVFSRSRKWLKIRENQL